MLGECISCLKGDLRKDFHIHIINGHTRSYRRFLQIAWWSRVKIAAEEQNTVHKFFRSQSQLTPVASTSDKNYVPTSLLRALPKRRSSFVWSSKTKSPHLFNQLGVPHFEILRSCFRHLPWHLSLVTPKLPNSAQSPGKVPIKTWTKLSSKNVEVNEILARLRFKIQNCQKFQHTANFLLDTSISQLLVDHWVPLHRNWCPYPCYPCFLSLKALQWCPKNPKPHCMVKSGSAESAVACGDCFWTKYKRKARTQSNFKEKMQKFVPQKNHQHQTHCKHSNMFLNKYN